MSTTEHAPNYNVDAFNRAQSAREVELFKSKPIAASYPAYLTRDDSGTYRITTWIGDTLAVVTSIVSRKDRRSWTTDTRGSFWAKGIDGRIYHGRHNGVGMWCRIRPAKRQPNPTPEQARLLPARNELERESGRRGS